MQAPPERLRQTGCAPLVAGRCATGSSSWMSPPPCGTRWQMPRTCRASCPAACPERGRLGRSAAGQLEVQRVVRHDHGAVAVALEVAHRHLDIAYQKRRGTAAIEHEALDLARLAVEHGVGTVAQVLAGLRDDIHARPDKAGVEVHTEALGGSGVKVLLAVAHAEHTLIHIEGVERHEAVGLLDHARHVGELHHKPHDLLARGVEYGEMHLAQPAGLARRAVLVGCLAV